MSLPREPFSWDGDDDVPVPLDDAGFDHPQPREAEEIVVVAESVVRDAQDAIARQDTDPTLTLPDPEEPATDVALAPSRFRARVTRVLKASLLAAGCALAFAHGWSVGATAVAGEPPATCDANHCSQDHER